MSLKYSLPGMRSSSTQTQPKLHQTAVDKTLRKTSRACSNWTDAPYVQRGPVESMPHSYSCWYILLLLVLHKTVTVFVWNNHISRHSGWWLTVLYTVTRRNAEVKQYCWKYQENVNINFLLGHRNDTIRYLPMLTRLYSDKCWYTEASS